MIVVEYIQCYWIPFTLGFVIALFVKRSERCVNRSTPKQG